MNQNVHPSSRVNITPSGELPRDANYPDLPYDLFFPHLLLLSDCSSQFFVAVENLTFLSLY